jgi:hypothetical protein
MPIGNVLVGDSRSHIEHDDSALALDVIAIPQTTKLLLPSRIPDIEADGAKIGCEGQRVDLNTESCC